MTYQPPGFEWRRYKWLRVSAGAVLLLELGSCSLSYASFLCEPKTGISPGLYDALNLLCLASIPFTIFALFVQQFLPIAIALCLSLSAGLTVETHFLRPNSLKCDSL